MTPKVAKKYRDGFDRDGGGYPERKCSRCFQWWPLNFFGKSPECRLGRDFRCAQCRNRARHSGRDRSAATRSADCQVRRQNFRDAEEIAKHYDYDGERMKRHARLLSALDPGAAEALKLMRPARKRRAA